MKVNMAFNSLNAEVFKLIIKAFIIISVTLEYCKEYLVDIDQSVQHLHYIYSIVIASQHDG